MKNIVFRVFEYFFHYFDRHRLKGVVTYRRQGSRAAATKKKHIKIVGCAKRVSSMRGDRVRVSSTADDDPIEWRELDNGCSLARLVSQETR